MNEFELIQRYVINPLAKQALTPANNTPATAKILQVGVGDDAAVVSANDTEDWLITTDSMIEGHHFLANQSPQSLAMRVLMVNASDIAAMGGIAKMCLLSLTLPRVNHSWLKKFFDAFHQEANACGITLIGGNTTRGQLSIGLTMIGTVPKGQAILRSGAKIGDEIWVTGQLGMAALGLVILKKKVNISLHSRLAKTAINAYRTPLPPLILAPKLLGIANAMIDISDGLLQDAAHLACASKAKIQINIDCLPSYCLPKKCDLTEEKLNNLRLTGGDDYQLFFTAPFAAHKKIAKLAKQESIELHNIGKVVAKSAKGKVCCYQKGTLINYEVLGFQHF